MTDTLRDRIAAVLREHVEDQLTNYDAGRNECGCGNQGLSGYVEHVADAVIAELDWEWGIQYHAVPSGVVLGRDENPPTTALEQRDTTTKSGSTENRHRL